MGCCRPLPKGSGVGRRKECLIPGMTPEKCPCPGMRPELRGHRQRRTGQGMRPGMRSGMRGCVPQADRP